MKKLLAELRAKLPDEVKSEVEGILSQMLSSFNTMSNNKTDAETEKADLLKEVMEKKGKIKELTSQVATITEEKASIEKTTEELKQQIEESGSYKEKLDGYLQKEWEGQVNEHSQKMKYFDVKEGDEGYKTIQAIRESGDFLFPEEGKEFTEDQIKHNVSQFATYEKFGQFKSAKTQPPGYTPPTGDDKIDPVEAQLTKLLGA